MTMQPNSNPSPSPAASAATSATPTRDPIASLPRSYSVRETAYVLGTGRLTVERWLKEGAFPYGSAFRADGRIHDPRVRFTKLGIQHGIVRMLRQLTRQAHITGLDDLLMSSRIHDWDGAMRARLDSIR